MAEWGRGRISRLTSIDILILGTMGGAFIAAGALFSLLLASGFESLGAQILVTGFGFSAGFFFVVLSEAALFTEANVVMPAALMARSSVTIRVLRFWGLAIVGNVLGAILFGILIGWVGHYDDAYTAHLAETVDSKMRFMEIGGLGGWSEAILSGIAANWLVGMAAFFATMGRTLIGKYIPVLLAVSLFVTAGFQHSPANIGYFSLWVFGGGELDIWDAIAWNLVPAGIGNVIGGTFLVALPFWYLYGRRADDAEA